MARLPRHTAADAFTLIEVLVAVVILATGITMVLRAFNTSLVALGAARDTLRAGMAIRERMALVRAAAADPDGGASLPAGRFVTADGLVGEVRIRTDDGVGAMSHETQGELKRVDIVVMNERTGFRQQASTCVWIPARGDADPQSPVGPQR